MANMRVNKRKKKEVITTNTVPQQKSPEVEGHDTKLLMSQQSDGDDCAQCVPTCSDDEDSSGSTDYEDE